MLIPRKFPTVFILTLLFGVVFPTLVMAGGVQEERYAQAKVLIEQKRYKEARDLLLLIQREDPEREDQTQELLNMIVRIEQLYNDKYAQALDAVEQKNLTLAQTLLEEMRVENPNPPRSLATNLRRLERSIRFVNSKEYFNKMMAEALTAIQEKNYRKAMTLYSQALTGKDLHQTEFAENDYGQTIKAVSQNALKDLLGAVTEFQNQEQLFAAALQDGLKAISASGENIDKTLGPLWSRMETLGLLRQRILENSLNFKEQGALIAKNFPDLAPDYFLDYAWNVSRGRGRAGVIEGISGVVQLIWDNTLTAWQDALTSRMEKALVQGEGAYNQGNWVQASASFLEVFQTSQAALRTLGLWNRLIFLGGDYSLNDDGIELWKAKGPAQRRLELRSRLASMSLEAAQIKTFQSEALARSLPSNNPSPDQIETDRRTMKQYRIQWQRFINDTGSWAAQSQALTGLGYPQLDNAAYTTKYRTLWEQGNRDNLNTEVTLTERKGTREFLPLNTTFENLTKLYNQALEQYNGVPSRTSPGKTSRFPTEASLALVSIRPDQTRLITNIQGFLTRYRNEEPLIRDDQKIQKIIQEGENLLAQSENLQGRIGTLIEQANALAAQAQSIKAEGEAALNRIETLLSRDETVAQARAAYLVYLEKIPQALDRQEDETYRQRFEENTATWDAQIYLRETDVMTLDVQRYIRLVQENYGIGRYIQANNELNQAQKRWNQTVRNKIDNPDIVLWKGLIANALNSSGDREVLATDPLFVEIRQLLNFATKDFEKGKSLKLQGQDPAALFASSEKYLKKVFVAYPRNKEANVLLLKLKAAGSTGDGASFMAQKVSDARAAMAQAQWQSALQQLEDLKEFDKTYPGLDGDIRTCRIRLGLEIDVDALAVARSQQLTNQAAAIAATGREADLRRAQELLNEARAVNRNNFQATELWLVINRRLTQLEVSNPVLTAAESAILQQATNTLNAGNVDEAKRLITVLYKNPKNQYILSVKRLYQRIYQ